MQRTNQEARHNPSTNQEPPYNQYLPPRDSYSTLPSRRPVSRTASLKSNENPRSHLPPPPSYGQDNPHKSFLDRGENGCSNDSRRTSYAESKDQFGSADGLNFSGRRDFSRDRASKPSDNDYLPPTRRTIAMLNGSLPRRHQYRSSASDTLDYSRKNPSAPPPHLAERVDHETLPPLPSAFGRKRDGSVQRSSSYLRQRAVDIANIYGAPLPHQEPTRLERDAENRAAAAANGDRDGSGSTSRGSSVSRYDDKYGDKVSDFQADRSRRSGSAQPMSRFRAGSLNREAGDRETVSQAIIRRQKSFDRLEQNDDSKTSKLRRPTSLDLRSTPDRSVLGKFLRDADGRLVEGEDGGLLRVGDQTPATSPVRSPGRKVSRFLRPDFYDTPREDSVFAKEKEEKSVAGVKSKKENIASFLELNYADLERNIAKDLLAISENAIKQRSDIERNGIISEVESGLASSQVEKDVSKDFNQNKTQGSKNSESPKIVKKETANKMNTEQRALEPSINDGNVGQLSSVKDESKPGASKMKVKSVALKDAPSNEEKSVCPTECDVTAAPKDEETTAKIKVKKKVKKADETASKSGLETGAAKVKKLSAKTDSTSTSSIVSNKNKFLRSLDKTIDKFKSADGEPKESKSRIVNVIRSLRESSLTPKGSEDVLTESKLIKRAVSVDDCSVQPEVEKSTNKIKKVIKSLKELTSNPKTNLDTETNLIKRATSVDDLSNPSQTKSNQVNSVLGMFRKMEEPKAEKKTSLLSRFRRTQSVYAGSSSDGVLDARLQRVSLGTESSKPARVAGKTSERPRSENLDQNVSCSIKIKTPKKEVSNTFDAPRNEVAKDDVSISETVKVVKVVKKENGPRIDLPNPATDAASAKIPLKGPVNVSNGDAERSSRPSGSKSERRDPRIKYYDPISSSSLLSEDESESLDSASIGSDWEPRTTSPLLPPSSRVGGADAGAESIEDRIRRKSFYTRFNDVKKKPATARKTSVTGIPTLRESSAPRKSSSFVDCANGAGK